MAVTAVGFDGTISEAQWSQIMLRQSEIAYRHGVWTGGDVTSGAGARTVDVSNLDAIVAGVWFVATSNPALTLAANGGNNPRIDYIVAEVNWTANTVVIKAVTGSANTPPALTQTAGTLWQMPLARCTVNPGATNVSNANIEACKPLPRQVQAHTVNIRDIGIQETGGNPARLATMSVTDPGWPYRLDITAGVNCRVVTVDQSVRLEVAAGGDVLAAGLSGPLNHQQPVHANAKPPRRFVGSTELALRFASADSNGPVKVGSSPMNTFDVHVIPA